MAWGGAGRMVERIFKGYRGRGKHEFSWEAGQFSAGIYFISLRADEIESIRKAVLIK